ncbi:MAG: hypothetical protein M1840_004737 [Geoglossum simile]|nr:MAG: hypothetical protein M1840_004737 [Geoglossum simile]
MSTRAFAEPKEIITSKILFRNIDEGPPKIKAFFKGPTDISANQFLGSLDDPPNAVPREGVAAALDAENRLADIIMEDSKGSLTTPKVENTTKNLEGPRNENLFFDREFYFKAASIPRARKGRIDPANSGCSQSNPRMRLPYSSRLPTAGLGAERYRKDELYNQDRAPFTVERHEYHQEFQRAMRDPKNDVLRKLERSAYESTIRDTTHISKPIKLITIRALAADRGIRRAALQHALRSFAANEEQRYSGELIYRRVPLLQPIQPTLARTQPTADSPNPPGLDHFKYTQLVVRLQDEQGWLANLVESEQRVQGNAPEICGIGLSSGAQPQMIPVFRGKLDSRRRQLFIIRMALRYELTEEDIFRTASADHSGQANPERLVTVFQDRQTKEHLGRFFTAFQLGIDSIQRPDRQQKVYMFLGADQDTADTPLSESDRIALWDLARASVSPPYKEARVHEMAAFRAGRQYSRIKDYLNPANQTVFERAIREHNRVMRVTLLETQDAIAKLFPSFAVAHFLTLRDIARSMPPAQGPTVAESDVRTIAGHLKAEVCRENHEDKRESGLDYAKLWSSTDHIPLGERGKTYFSTERWPPKSPATESTSPKPAPLATRTLTPRT